MHLHIPTIFLNIVDRHSSCRNLFLALSFYPYRRCLLIPLVNLVSRLSALVTVPTENYLFVVVLTPVVSSFFAETSAQAAAADRGKGRKLDPDPYIGRARDVPRFS